MANGFSGVQSLSLSYSQLFVEQKRNRRSEVSASVETASFSCLLTAAVPHVYISVMKSPVD